MKNKSPCILTTKLVRQYELYLREQERAESTIQKYVSDLLSLAVFLDGSIVTKIKLIEWKEHLIQNYSLATINSKLAAVNGFLIYNGLSTLKLRQMKVQRVLFRDGSKELTRSEYVRLVRVADKTSNRRLALVLQTICATGIRVSELKFITVEAVREGRAVINSKGKRRPIFLPERLRHLLKRYCQKQKITMGPVFTFKFNDYLGKPLIYGRFQRIVG